MRLVRSLLSFALPNSTPVIDTQSPGAPPHGMKNSYALTAYQTALNTIVTPGDIVLLKWGKSKDRSNWAAIVRFGNFLSHDSRAGYATLYQYETTGFGTVTPSANAVYIRASSHVIHKVGGAVYTIHLSRF